MPYKKDKESVEENDIHRMMSLPRNFVLIFEVHGEKYNIMQVIGYIVLHWKEQSDEFWDEKNDINMYDYNPLESPRASRPGGRETPTRRSVGTVPLHAQMTKMLCRLKEIYSFMQCM
jgi:hypothetical protein